MAKKPTYEEQEQRIKELEKAEFEREIAEEAFRESKEELKTIVDAAPVQIWYKDRTNQIIRINQAAADAFGKGIEDIEGKPVGELFPEDDSGHYHEDDLEVINSGKSKLNIIEEMRITSGERRYVCTDKVPYMDKNGKIQGVIAFVRDITEHRLAEQALKEREKELEIKTINLEEVNAALKVLLKKREEDKKELEETVLSNMKELVAPYMEKFKTSGLNTRQISLLSVIESNLNDIVIPFSRHMSMKYSNLTPKEIQVAGLVKDGKTTKEIAEMLNSSTSAINFHRNNLRQKLGLKNKKSNLRSHLLSFM